MNVPALRSGHSRADLERFRAALVQKIGLQFDDRRLPFLDDVLQRRLDRLCWTSTRYLNALEDEPERGELGALARELTVGETYFFRHNDQFRAFAEVALPERMRARAKSRSLRLLSAGCASGEEAYSLAIVGRETVADPTWQIAILGIDLNPLILAKAARAHYSPWALRSAPAELRRKWFHAENGEFVLEETVRCAVQFREGNLAGADPELWQADAYDVIFCRNVLMYFSPAQMRAAIERIAQSLAPGGYLFLGHAETLRGMSDGFDLCSTHDTFYYRRREHVPAAGRQQDFADGAAAAAAVPALPTAWFDTIGHASDRVAALMAAASVTRDAMPQPGAPGWQLGPAFELLRDERFDDALDHVCTGPSSSEAEPDVLLVKAVLLAQGGRFAAAQVACERLLLIDELNAGAHYVLALCSEHAGLHERAIRHDRRAAHLDPAFAMPRLHCGLQTRHAGDRDTARRELSQALVLLKREDVSRLLLFGGGFSRDALIALCRAAIADCGGRP